MTRTDINDFQPNELDEATRECLNRFKVTDPKLDMERIELSKDLLIKDCYDWILQDRILQEWRDSNTSPLLWINGDPGKGKTMLMIALVRELSKNLSGNPPTVIFFFCQSTEPQLNNAVAILRGLIWKLAMDHPRLAGIFRCIYESDSSLLEGPNTVLALFSALTSMLNESPGTAILIDALDECNPGIERDQLLDLIKKNAGSSSKYKWLLSSRNNPDIKQKLMSKSQMLSLEMNKSHISQAVDAFIKWKTSELAKLKNYNQSLADSIEKELRAKSDSTFLWVALACKSLVGVTSRNALSTLQKLPSGLEKFYERMMEEILQNKHEGDKTFCLQILCCMSLAFRPFAIEELVAIAELPMDFLENDLLELLEFCGSFVTVRESIVYFVHQSAKDYLVANRAQRFFSTKTYQQQGLFVDRSLQAMTQTLQQDICRLKHPGSQACTATINTQLKAISYMCSFWVDHLVKYFDSSSAENIPYQKCLVDEGSVHRFLLEHLLHWFEALSLLGEFNRGVLAILALESLILVIPLHFILQKAC